MTDYSDYKKLYLLCFTDDTEEDAELLFKTVLSKAHKVCEYENGKPIAMLFLMEADLISKDNKYPFYYLYAACTHPKYRGKGIMGRLLDKAIEFAFQKEKLGIFLKPATSSLFDFYSKYGFSPFFSFTKATCSAKEISDMATNTDIFYESITMDEWYTKRKEFLEEQCDLYADFNKDLFTAATSGCTAIATKNSAVVYELRDDMLLVKEAVCYKNAEDKLLNLIATITNKINPEKVEMRFPPSFNHPKLSVVAQPFSVIKDNGKLPKESFAFPYHGFAFD